MRSCFRFPVILSALILMVVSAMAQAPTWVESQTRLPAPVSAIAIAADMTVYAGTIGAGVYRSTNEGLTFEAINNGIGDASITVVAIAPDGMIVAGTDDGLFTMRPGVDGSVQWLRSPAFPHAAITSLTIDNGGRGFLATCDGGCAVHESSDLAGAWIRTSLVTEITHIHVDIQRFVFAAGSDSSLYVTSFDAAVWLRYANSFSGVTAIASDLGTTLYVGAGNLYRVTLRGQRKDSLLSGSLVRALTVTHIGEIVVAIDSMVKSSPDDGATWVESSDAFRGDTVSVLATTFGEIVMAGTRQGRIFRSLARPAAAEPSDIRSRDLTIRVVENNARNARRLEVTSGSSQLVRLTIVDLLGRTVLPPEKLTIEPGTRHKGFDLHDLPRGIYLVRAVQGERSITTSMVVR